MSERGGETPAPDHTPTDGSSSRPVTPPTMPGRLVHPARARHCICCGYDIVSQMVPDGTGNTAAVCPECGTPLLRTMQGDSLHYTSPEHLRTLRRASLIIILALLAWIILLVSGHLLPLFRAAVFLGPEQLDAPRPPLLTVLSGGALLAALWGWWRLASPDPSTPWMTGLTLRRILRCSIIAAAVVTILDRVSLAVSMVDFVSTFLAMVWFAHLIIAMLYTRQLGRRLHAQPVQYWAVGVLIATGLLFFPCLTFMVLSMIIGPVVINTLVIAALAELRVALGRTAMAASGS